MDNLTLDTPRTTHNHPFGIRDSDDQPLFCIPEGARAEDALAHASLLLKGAYETTYELTDIGLGHSGLLWSVLHLVESAKALVDAVVAQPHPTAHT
ncbi:DUF3077 domain-containing protein [Pseudomonas sp. App30]|uniref:DUF3077 domain-containing protein n=1 Tax=Pseudomonas sp. App30 TaxID=3068990 RepID=UPI003A7FFA86